MNVAGHARGTLAAEHGFCASWRDRAASARCARAEGVLWAPKDFMLPEHPELKGVRNLHIIKAMQSFESKEYVTVRYAWRNFYWFLTDAGIEYLREYLNIPAEVVPATLMKAVARCAPPPRGTRSGHLVVAGQPRAPYLPVASMRPVGGRDAVHKLDQRCDAGRPTH